jgi:hypothetical protein
MQNANLAEGCTSPELIRAFCKLTALKRSSAVLVLCVSAAGALQAQTFTTLYDFCGKNPSNLGGYPSSRLLQ